MLAAVRLALPLSKAEMTICTVPPVLVRIVTRYSLYNGIDGLLCERLLQDRERDSQSRAESLVLGGQKQAPSGRSLRTGRQPMKFWPSRRSVAAHGPRTPRRIGIF